jgi:hypothetical protein
MSSLLTPVVEPSPEIIAANAVVGSRWVTETVTHGHIE